MNRAFTLVEMVVVLGVVVLLTGLTVSVTSAVIEQAERRDTRSTLQLLHTAVKEWEAVSGRRLTWWNKLTDPEEEKLRADVRSDTPEVLVITDILEIVMQAPTAREIVARIDGDFVYTYEESVFPPWIDDPQEKTFLEKDFVGMPTVLDAWGKPIYATHPGRPWRPGDTESPYSLHEDPDGTIRTYNEYKYGIAPNRTVVFVSAGPDGFFGLTDEFQHLAAAERGEAIERARKDNLYSVPVSFESYSG